MQSNTILWIGGIALVAILGICVLKASQKGTNKTKSKVLKKDDNATQTSPSSEQIQTKQPKPLNQLAAKTAFLNNINRFVPRLCSLCDGTYNSNDWIDDIVDINDDDLMFLWKKIHNDSKAIVRILSAWGLKPEMCTSFVCMDFHKDLYTSVDGTAIEVGKQYDVKQQCWILTKSDSNGEKKVIVKGKVV